VKNDDGVPTKKPWKIFEVWRELKFLWKAFWRWKSKFHGLFEKFKERFDGEKIQKF